LAAYQLQIPGAPSWLESDRFALDARANTPADENQLRQMLQALLAERFHLTIHHEIRETAVYFLTVGKSRARLTEQKEGVPRPAPPPEREGTVPITLTAKMEYFIPLIRTIGNIDHPIVDRTGLDGVYYFFLRWNADDDMKSLVEDEFGLKFVPDKAPVDIVVVDHIERASEN
jgi:uncharacterized protein (TIGR03435 family)